MGGGKNKKNRNRETQKILGREVWGKIGVQMVLNDIIKKRYTHEDIIQALGQLLEIEKWDDTNFITFENYIFSIARTIKSNDTRISYQILWKKYLEKKGRSRTAKNVALVSDEVTKILEVIPEYAGGASHEGIGQYSIGK